MNELVLDESGVSEPLRHADEASMVDQASNAVRIYGKPLEALPKDLYIPPEALEVFLEAFEGPLDLLLYLIKKQNVDILDIPVAEITHQYMEYVQLISALQLELAAEYLVMAATLGEIKSFYLLPKPPSVEQEEEDPRLALIKRLQNYERFKQASEAIDELPRMERDYYSAHVSVMMLQQAESDTESLAKKLPDVLLKDLLHAFKEVILRANLFQHHHIQREALSTRERMSHILKSLQKESVMPFFALFAITEGRAGVVVTFLATLELIKEGLVAIVQKEAYAPIYLKSK